MTLNITVVTPWGIWQCSDHRLTDPLTGSSESDDSVKHLAFHFPDGGALLTFCGIGSVGGVSISDWVREVMRGGNRSLDQSLVFLTEQATISIGPLVAGKFWHMFTIGAFLRQRPWVIQIRNFATTTPREKGPPVGEFLMATQQITDRPMLLVSGTREALTEQNIDDLASVISRRPNRPTDYHELLAKYNRLASQHPTFGRFISSSCLTSYMPPEAIPIESRQHDDSENPPTQITVPILVYGIDATEIERLLMQQITKLGTGDSQNYTPPSLEEAGRRSVEPKNRLLPNHGEKRRK